MKGQNCWKVQLFVSLSFLKPRAFYESSLIDYCLSMCDEVIGWSFYIENLRIEQENKGLMSSYKVSTCMFDQSSLHPSDGKSRTSTLPLVLFFFKNDTVIFLLSNCSPIRCRFSVGMKLVDPIAQLLTSLCHNFASLYVPFRFFWKGRLVCIGMTRKLQ